MDKVKAEVSRVGDMGEVAQASRQTQKTLFAPAPLTVRGVFKSLHSIAKMEGKEMVKRKRDMIKQMLVACRESEAKYIVRALQGNLRIGLKGRWMFLVGDFRSRANATSWNRVQCDQSHRQSLYPHSTIYRYVLVERKVLSV